MSDNTEQSLVEFVKNASYGEKFCYCKSTQFPSVFLEEIVEEFYKFGYVHKEQQSLPRGLHIFFVVRTLKSFDRHSPSGLPSDVKIA